MNQEGSDPPRQPNNYQQLLRICMANAEYEGPTRTDHVTSTSEDRQWLAEALQGLTSDIINEMMECIDVIKKGLIEIESSDQECISQETIDEIEGAIDALIDHTGSIDNASDFYKIGGFDLFPLLFSVPSNTLVAKTAELLAEIVQNHKECQKHAIQFNLLETLVKLLDTSKDDNVKIKSLYAISCMIRDNEQAQDAFENKLDGFSVLLKAIQTSDGTSGEHKLRIKASFLINSLCRQRPAFREVLHNMGFVELLIALLHNQHDSSHEHLLAALHSLVTQHDPSRIQCQRDEYGLEKLLKDRIELVKGKSEFLEEEEYCKEILQYCFGEDEFPETER